MCIVCKLSGFNLHSAKNDIVEKVDAAANSGSIYSLSAGDSFSGILDNKNDEDWIKIDLKEGETYTFELKSLSDDSELNNTFIELYDADENLIKRSSYASEISFTAEYSGSFYLSTNSNNNEEINYILSSRNQRSLPSRDFGDFAPVSVDSSNTWSEISESNPYIEGLMVGDGFKWGDNPTNSDTNLNYYIYEDETIEGNQAYEVASEETAAFISAMGAFSSVSNLNFNEGESDEDSHILWAVLDDDDSEGALGWAYTPSSGNYSGLTTQNWESYSESGELADPDILLPGSYYFITAIHELGHAIGLSHPHDDDNVFPGVDSSSDGGDNGLNATPYTVMTYNDVDANDYVPNTLEYSGYLETLGAFDIAAVQYLYGANENQSTGNNTYNLEEDELNGWQCIWDNGGTDTISAESALNSVNIDLRNATLENEEGGGGFVSQIGDQSKGYLIAYNSTGECIIENAVGSGSADEIRGNSGKNTINGNAGNDEINGDAGNDKLYGAGGNDTIYGESGDDYIKGHSGNDTLYGGEDDDELKGGSGKDKLYGGADSDTLYGEDGDDYIKGHSGADTLYGGEDDDELKGGSGKDKLYGGADSDTLYGEDGDDYLKGHSGNDTLHGGEGDDHLKGGTGKDKLYGASGGDLIYGEDGDDYIKGHSGADTLYGGKDDDTLKGGSSSDNLYGGSGKDLIYGESGNDYLKGHSGDDTLHGGEGDDKLKGGTGKDKLYGASGGDLIYGEDGDDYIKGHSGADTLYGGKDDDTLKGGSSSDNLYGGADSDTLYGEDGDDYLKGHSGVDKLYGGKGNDTLIGGEGKDEIYGGSGDDTFKLTSGSGYDRIRDFEKGEDRIYIKGIDDLRVVDTGKHSKIYNGSKDLLAIIYNEDDLSISGNYLI